MEKVENENTPKVLLEEKLKVPVRVWINSVGLIFVAVAFTLGRPHVILYFITILITLAQIKFLLNYYQTGYRLTVDGLQIMANSRVVENIPYADMLQINDGEFRDLIKDPAVKQLKDTKDITAYPKLGGVKHISLLVYQQEQHNKAVFFQPSLTMRMFITDRIREQVS